MADVLRYLASKGIQPKQVVGNEARFRCFFHDEVEGKRGRLYVNIDPNEDPGGPFWCHVCAVKGNIITLKRHFGDPIAVEETVSESRAALFQAACAFYQANLEHYPEIYRYLVEERGLTQDTIEEFQIGYASSGLHSHLKGQGIDLKTQRDAHIVSDMGGDFFDNEIIIPYLVNGSCVSLRGKKIGGKYRGLPHDTARLFNTDVCWTNDKVAIAEGEFDAMLLNQSNIPAVGVPGANNFRQEWADYFRGVKRVYVMFDTDQAGRSGAVKVMEKIGSKATNVELPIPNCDITDWVVQDGHSPEELRELLTQAYDGLLITVDEAYREWSEVDSTPGMALGFGNIDHVLNKGVRPGQVVVSLAKAGTGKTIMLINVFDRVLRADPGRKILFVSLEQTRAEWFDRARKIYRFYDPFATDADILSFYRERLMVVDKNRVTEDDLIRCIQDYEERQGSKPDLVAIDYLGYFARSYKGERYQQVSDAIMTIKAIAKEERIAIFIPHQVSKMVMIGDEPDPDSGRDSGVILETADFLFTLWAPGNRTGTSPEDRDGTLRMKLGKSRSGGLGRSFTFKLAPLSLAMIPDGEIDNIVKAEAEVRWNKQPQFTWEMAVKKHQEGDNGRVVI